jgi:hypothetical protein
MSTVTDLRPLGRAERAAVAAVVALVGVLGVLGMVNSFARVAEAVAPSFGHLAWTVPLGIDIGIAVFTGLDIVLARLGMRTAWLRVFPWALVITTVYLNIADETTGVGIVAHAMLPGLWVIAVEAGSHAIRVRAGLHNGRAGRQMDRVRRSRWMLAPLATVKLWRRMVLWEMTDYGTALRRERDRQLARCELVDRYGRLSWRWKAPRRQRVLYRLGDLAPTRTLDPTTPAAAPTTATKARRPRTAGKAAGKARATAGATVDDLVPDGLRLAATAAAEGRRLTRDELRAELGISNTRASALLARLRELDALDTTPTPTTQAPAEVPASAPATVPAGVPELVGVGA